MGTSVSWYGHICKLVYQMEISMGTSESWYEIWHSIMVAQCMREVLLAALHELRTWLGNHAISP